MKAEQGRTYALVVKGAVRQIFDASTLPEWHDGLTVVDVTGNIPVVGALYDGIGFITPPVAPTPPRPRSRSEALELALIRKGVLSAQEVEDERVR